MQETYCDITFILIERASETPQTLIWSLHYVMSVSFGRKFVGCKAREEAGERGVNLHLISVGYGKMAGFSADIHAA
jgi:hypothetical protein